MALALARISKGRVPLSGPSLCSSSSCLRSRCASATSLWHERCAWGGRSWCTSEASRLLPHELIVERASQRSTSSAETRILIKAGGRVGIHVTGQYPAPQRSGRSYGVRVQSALRNHESSRLPNAPLLRHDAAFLVISFEIVARQRGAGVTSTVAIELHCCLSERLAGYLYDA